MYKENSPCKSSGIQSSRELACCLSITGLSRVCHPDYNCPLRTYKHQHHSLILGEVLDECSMLSVRQCLIL